jgi:ribosomal protein L29
MATHSTLKELRNMQTADLRKEVEQKRVVVAKMRLGLEMRSEKDSALYRREKRELARILTVLGEKQGSEPAPAKATTGKTPLKKASKSRKVAAPRHPVR